jgi:pimeloyl-ACP methyl ester carboxylesterase
LALADQIGAERFSVVGHSLGGRAALALALSHPERIDRIAVLDVSASDLTPRPSPISGMMQALLRAPERAADRASMRGALIAAGAEPKEADALLVHVDDGAWTIDRGALAELRMTTMGTDLWAAVDPRVGLVYGTESPFVKPEDVERYRSAGAGIVAIPGAGHLLHLEAPAAVSDAIVSLLAKSD